MFESISKHFKHPHGLIGIIVGKIMAWENKKLNKWTINRLELQPSFRILEIGYGPGYCMKYILCNYPNIYVDGLDVSATMQKQATRRLKSYHTAHLFVGEIEDSPLLEATYERIFAVNNYTLWSNRQMSLEILYRALKPEGIIAITMQPRQEDAVDQQAEKFAEDICIHLKACGFKEIDVQYKKLKPTKAVCVTALK